MLQTRIRTVAIVGGGPAGATLATYLARAGIRVAIFAKPRREQLIIGESLVPAIVPFLKDLGLEDEVEAFSIFKPGATWTFGPTATLSFNFRNARGARTTYAYNTPRDLFDDAILRGAERSGALIVRKPAILERVAESDRVRLSGESTAALGAHLGPAPDLIVDASGRGRLISNLLRIPTDKGLRHDAALFAHAQGVPLGSEGHVLINRLQHGWGWRIPLPGKVSVGIVAPHDHLRRFGSSVEEQFDNCLRTDPTIALWGTPCVRTTQVMKYSNYQLASRRGVGDGWALIGDAFGFVDPAFSSGLLIGMDGARRLAQAILNGSESDLMRCERHVRRHLRAWQQTVDYFYDGKLFTLLRIGEEAKKTFFGKVLARHLDTHLPRVFTGEATTKWYSLGLLNFMCAHALGGKNPEDLAIR